MFVNVRVYVRVCACLSVCVASAVRLRPKKFSKVSSIMIM